ncbi:hypothetical protein MMC12_008207 [Toensbergia leucococca]|nr:hypothetical protein [Toensbergia leucococca]
MDTEEELPYEALLEPITWQKNILVATVCILWNATTYNDRQCTMIILCNFPWLNMDEEEYRRWRVSVKYHGHEWVGWWDIIHDAGPLDRRIRGMVELLKRRAFAEADLTRFDMRVRPLEFLEEVVEMMKDREG